MAGGHPTVHSEQGAQLSHEGGTELLLATRMSVTVGGEEQANKAGLHGVVLAQALARLNPQASR